MQRQTSSTCGLAKITWLLGGRKEIWNQAPWVLHQYTLAVEGMLMKEQKHDLWLDCIFVRASGVWGSWRGASIYSGEGWLGRGRGKGGSHPFLMASSKHFNYHLSFSFCGTPIPFMSLCSAGGCHPESRGTAVLQGAHLAYTRNTWLQRITPSCDGAARFQQGE